MCLMSEDADVMINRELLELASEYDTQILATEEESSLEETAMEETSTEETSEETSLETTEPETESTTQESPSTVIPETTTEPQTTKENPTKKTKETTTQEESELSTEEELEETTEAESAENLDAYEDIGVVVNDNPEKFGTLYWPLPSEYGTAYITSGYGYRTGTYSGMHRGLDIGAPEGTPIFACEDGVVIASYYSDSAGNFTVIQHEGGVYTEYMHQSVRYVKAGETVKAGQMIGRVGSTGWSTGSHLHLGVVLSEYGYDTSKRVNPLPYLVEENADKKTEKTKKEQDTPLREITEKDLRFYYADGTQVTDVVKADPDRVSVLESVFSKEAITKVKTSGFEKKGYLTESKTTVKKKNAAGLAIKQGYNKLEDTWIRYETPDYDLKLTIVSSYNNGDKDCPLAASLDSVDLKMNTSIFRKADLTKPVYEELEYTKGQYYALGVHVDVFKHGTKQRIDLPEVYQAILDVDMGQSYVCVNEAYAADKLFLKSKKAFNKNKSDNDRKNYITPSGIIYSDYGSVPVEVIKNPSKSNLYRQTEALGEEGLDLVFGFTHGDSIGLAFYLPYKTVTFNCGTGGSVSTEKAEVLLGHSLDQSVIARTNSGYRFKCWVTDQDVRVEDMILKKGDEITMYQIENLVITDDMSFTAKFTKR